MILYQPRLRGSYASFDNVVKIYSKRVYRTRQEAEAALPGFIERNTGQGLFDLCREELESTVLELELVEHE